MNCSFSHRKRRKLRKIIKKNVRFNDISLEITTTDEGPDIKEILTKYK